MNSFVVQFRKNKAGIWTSQKVEEIYREFKPKALGEELEEDH